MLAATERVVEGERKPLRFIRLLKFSSECLVKSSAKHGLDGIQIAKAVHGIRLQVTALGPIVTRLSC
jgi:hypothetical protein